MSESQGSLYEDAPQIELAEIGAEGLVLRHNGIVYVYVNGRKPKETDTENGIVYLDHEKGTCMKAFKNRTIYLPKELKRARSEILGDVDLIIGMTGYSEMTRAQGMSQEAYEEACSSVLANAIEAIRDEFNIGHATPLKVGIVHGGIKEGVDAGAIAVANLAKLPQLGYSCPRYLLPLKDDSNEAPLYISPSKGLYSRRFVGGLDILISCGGRSISLGHDLLHLNRFHREAVVADILSTMSKGSPVYEYNELTGKGEVMNATRAFLESIGGKNMFKFETWAELLAYVRTRSTEVARLILQDRQHYRAFGSWRSDLERTGSKRTRKGNKK